MLAWRSAFGTVARSIKLYCNVDDKKTIDFFFPSTLRKKKIPSERRYSRACQRDSIWNVLANYFSVLSVFPCDGISVRARARVYLETRTSSKRSEERKKEKKKKLNDAFRYIRRVHVSFLERTKGQNTLYAPPPPPSLPHCSCPFVLRRWTDR